MAIVSIITGQELVPPVYTDSRGKRQTFQAALRRFGALVREPVEGEATVLGLVLHRPVKLDGVPPPHGERWIISDPLSGRAVAKGGTRQDALDDLAHEVGLLGGEEAFRSAMKEA